MNVINIKNANITDVLLIIKGIAEVYGYQVYAVGGLIRDTLMGKKTDDIDILVDKDGVDNPAIEFVNLIEKNEHGINKAVYPTFGVGKIDINGYKVEFVMPRGEKYSNDSRKPQVTKIDIEEDALRRDFTINSLMVNLQDMTIIDPTGRGEKDIKDKIIRSANPDIDKMLSDDPLRMLRAIRFHVYKRFDIDNELLKGIEKNKERIKIVSKERIREELNKILLADKPSRAFKITGTTGLLEIILPEIYDLIECRESPPYHWDESTFEHTMRVLDNSKPDLYIRLAALFHDVSKPETKTVGEDGIAHFYEHEVKGAKKTKEIMRKLTYSSEEVRIVSKLVYGHMRMHFYKTSWKDKTLRKLVVDLGDLFLSTWQLTLADTVKQGPKDVKDIEYLNELKNRINKLTEIPIKKNPIINGNDIQDIFSLKAGPWIKTVIDYVLELQYENPDITKTDIIEKLKVSDLDKIDEIVKTHKEAYNKPYITSLQ